MDLPMSDAGSLGALYYASSVHAEISRQLLVAFGVQSVLGLWTARYDST